MTDSLRKEQRSRYIKTLIKEAIINILAEQELESQPASAVPPATTQPAPETNMPQPPPPEQQESEELTVDSLVDKMNLVRGGKSFTDPEVYGKLTTFFNGLSEEQKTSLDYLLSEMGKIVLGAETPELDQAGGNPQSVTQPQQPPAPTTSPAPQSAPPVAASQAPVTPTA